MKRASRVRTRLAVVALACALATSACGGGSSANDPTAERGRYQVGLVGDQGDAGTPVKGGSLTIADYTEARSLDPAVTYADGAAGGDAMAAIYDVLVRYDATSNSYQPQLAKSLTPSADFTTWTLELRPDVTFTDGAPLDAKAVVASINRYMANRGADTAMLAPNVAKMTPKGDLTVVFSLRTAWAGFPTMLAQAAGMIVSPNSGTGADFKPIGAGPFTLESYAPGESMVLKANPDYFAGRPNLDTLKFVWPLTDDAKLDMMKSQAADVAYIRNPETVDAALAADLPGSLSLGTLGNVVIINNRDGSPGADVRVRRAIALALDPTVDFQRSYDGHGLPGSEIFPLESRWHSTVGGVSVDLTEAKKLLDEAKADGYDGTITYMDGTDPTSRAEAVATKAMLERVGFTVKFDFVASVADQIQKMYVDHSFDLARGALSVQENDPYVRLQSNFNSTSFGNASGYANPAMDAALVKLQAAGTDAEAQAALDTIQTLVNDTVPVVNVGAAAVFLPWQADVHGVVPTVNNMLLFGSAWKN